MKEWRIVVQKRQSLLGAPRCTAPIRREETTLLTCQSDISIRKYLFLLKKIHTSPNEYP